MKLVSAVIKKVKLDDVTLALEEVPGFPGMTITDARGMDREHVEHPDTLQEELTDFRPCIRLEVLVEDELAPRVVEAIRCAAHTGLRGDGRVWVQRVEEAYDIRCEGESEA